MGKLSARVKPPDAEVDRGQLIKESKYDLEDLLEDPARLDNLAALAEALKQANGRRKER